MVWAHKINVFLLLNNFFGHEVPNVGSRFRVTQLEFLTLKTTSCFQPMDADIIASFKAKHQKLVIQYLMEYFSANKVFAIDIYQIVVIVE